MPAVKETIKVAIASDFLNAFTQIPKKQQEKVLEFVNKFKADPTSAAINYEKVHEFKDQNLRSVRIDQAYRGIVLKPESGNVHVLLWVAHHDDAYGWAKNKVVNIHPETGSLQVLTVDESTIQIPAPASKEVPGLFETIKDKHLLRLGVPELLLPLVRSMKSEKDLDAATDKLPQEAFEALFFLASGYSLEDVLREMEVEEEPKPVDTQDFGKALDNPDSKRRFYVVEDDLELAAIMEAPLEKWRVFLHPSQRKLVERDWNGPVRVLGGAGTGKTVAAIHRARWLAQKVFNEPNDRILFTTFTKNLAADIRENLSKLCGDDALKRIEVVNLSKWVNDFLKKNGYSFEIDYSDKSKILWQEALQLSPKEPQLEEAFYREEWEGVIQPQGVMTLDQYYQAYRIGRGTRLNRVGRKAVWPVFEEYRVLLNEKGLKEEEDAMRDAASLLEQKMGILSYRAIIVDEAQDMGTQAFKLISRMIPQDSKNSLFIVGDAHQRIYHHKVVLSQCGIDIRGRSRKLKINYRTTDEIRRWAVHLLEGLPIDDLDGQQDDQKGYKSLMHGALPSVHSFANFPEEVKFIANYLKEVEKAGESINEVCLVARTKELVKQYESALKEIGFETYQIKRSEAEDLRSAGLRLATMHRVKGLEFSRMIIAGVNEGIIPYQGQESESSDPTVRRDHEQNERALLYVAATRAKKEVIISGFGIMSTFVNEIANKHSKHS
jgi:superfamily I DNA/RNA helicase